jgi:hypothetical protein
VGRTPTIVAVCQEARTRAATPHTASAITTSENIKTEESASLLGFIRPPLS